MDKIVLLDPAEAQKIAAGEVVERPVSILKELVENALDAGATRITIYLEDGGKELIRVVDNGCGMSFSDAGLALQRHATSKITRLSDLESLTTYGFRGEALSAIASVSCVRLKTKRAEDDLATCLTVENGIASEVTQTSGVTGTDIMVTQLFYMVPARLKFLKTRASELRAMHRLFCHIACMAPHVEFKLYHHDALLYTCPSAADLHARLGHLYPADMIESLLPVHEYEQRLQLSIGGFISNRHFSHHSRQLIHTFVNNRLVKNQRLSRAVLVGYQQMLRDRRFPVGWLLIDVNPMAIDVNVHPRKEEISFVHEQSVEQIIRRAVSKRLSQAQHTYVMSSSANENEPEKLPENLSKNSTESVKESVIQGDFQGESQSKFGNMVVANSQSMQSVDRDDAVVAALPEKESVLQSIFSFKHDFTAPAVDSSQQEQAKVHEAAETSYQILGQALKTYIVIATPDGITLVDQHAAHERILYEKLCLSTDSADTIALIQPYIISLTSDACDIIEGAYELLKAVGIVTRRMHADRIAITHCPPLLKNKPLDKFINDFLVSVEEHDENPQKMLYKKIHILISCFGAVRAGHTLSHESMRGIISQLMSIKNNLTCPHGRPTIWPLEKKYIEKKFKRDYAARSGT